MARAIASGDRIFEILDTRPSIRDREGATPIEEVRGVVEFHNVSFTYPDTTDQVLTDIRMEAARALLRQGLTAQEAARRVGFPHPGRFSAAYRRAFGHSPLQERGAARG